MYGGGGSTIGGGKSYKFHNNSSIQDGYSQKTYRKFSAGNETDYT